MAGQIEALVRKEIKEYEAAFTGLEIKPKLVVRLFLVFLSLAQRRTQ